MVPKQVGDWEEALAKYNASREEAAALANSQAMVMENRAMSLAEGQSAPFLGITCHHGSHHIWSLGPFSIGTCCALICPNFCDTCLGRYKGASFFEKCSVICTPHAAVLCIQNSGDAQHPCLNVQAFERVSQCKVHCTQDPG